MTNKKKHDLNIFKGALRNFWQHAVSTKWENPPYDQLGIEAYFYKE